MSFGKRLADARTSARMSQSELARRTGIAQQYISLLESGKNANVSGAHALRLARALHVTVDYLLGGDGSEQATNGVPHVWDGTDRRASLRETYRALMDQAPNIDDQTLRWLDKQFASFVEQVGEDRRRVRKMAERSAGAVPVGAGAILAGGDEKKV